jgi:hypothetical protein
MFFSSLGSTEECQVALIAVVFVVFLLPLVFTGDLPRMFKVIQQTKRPCLAFKILAAGRLSERPEWVERAFRDTFAALKPTDAVIVGFYDRYSDQPAECAALTRRFGSTAPAR